MNTKPVGVNEELTLNHENHRRVAFKSLYGAKGKGL